MSCGIPRRGHEKEVDRNMMHDIDRAEDPTVEKVHVGCVEFAPVQQHLTVQAALGTQREGKNLESARDGVASTVFIRSSGRIVPLSEGCEVPCLESLTEFRTRTMDDFGLMERNLFFTVMDNAEVEHYSHN